MQNELIGTRPAWLSMDKEIMIVAARGATRRAAKAAFNGPYRIELHSSGDLFVAEIYNHAIRRVTPSGVVTTVAGLKGVPVGNVNGSSDVAKFYYPRGMAFEGTSFEYVADQQNHAIRKVEF